ncbi:hypothetical protein ACVIWU_006538 [Bradyrhizobium sp. USDA 4509]
MTLNRRGISSSVLVTSSPIFASRDPPQQAQLVGASMTTRSCSMSSGQGLRTGRLRVKGRTLCVFAAAACAASSSSLAVATRSSSSSSSCSSSRAVRSERCPYSSRLSFSIRSSRCAISASLSDSSARTLAATASARSRASRSACGAARALARSDGRSSGFDIMKLLNQIKQQIQTVKAAIRSASADGFLEVGSRTGAPHIQEPWMCTFPAPASSHAACGFPALRAPIRFASRFMGPITLGSFRQPCFTR